MRKFKNDEAGFSSIHIIVGLVLLIIVCIGVYIAHNHQPDKPVTSTNSSAVKQLTYCDTVYQYCFRYPSNWDIEKSSSAQKWGEATNVAVTSPANKTSVLYLANVSVAPPTSRFTVVSVGKSSLKNQALDVVGGYFAAQYYSPLYFVASASLVDRHAVTVGQAIQASDISYFFSQNSKQPTAEPIKFEANAVIQNYTSGLQAQKWFDTPDARASLQILKSLYKQ